MKNDINFIFQLFLSCSKSNPHSWHLGWPLHMLRFWSIYSTEKFMISRKSQEKMPSLDISLYICGLVEKGIKTSSIWRIFGANLEANSSVFRICLSSQEMPRLLLRHIHVFSICLGKKNAEAIEFLGLLKKILFQE